MSGILDFLQAVRRTGVPQFDPNDPMSYGRDMPSQGGIGGQMEEEQPEPLQDTSQYPNLPAAGPPPDASTGGYPGIPQKQGIMSNPVLNPTVDPNVTNMGVGGYQPGSMEQGPMTDYTGTGAQAPQGGTGQRQTDDEFYNQYMSRYHPAHTQQDYYNQLMMQYPTRNMHPGFMRRLAAGFAGFGGGPDASQKVLDEPYNAEVQDWKNRIQPALSSANLERYENVNQRQLIGQEASRATQDYRAKTYAKDVERKEDADKAKSTQSAANRAFRYWKEQHHKSPPRADNDGRVYVIDDNNEAKYVTTTDGDFVYDKDLPEQDRLQIQHDNKMEEGKQRGDQAAARTDEAGWQGPYTDPATNDVYDYNIRTGERRKSKASPDSVKPGTAKAGGGKTTPFADAQRQRNIANQILNTDPNSHELIKFDGNRVVVDPDNTYPEADAQQKAYIRRLQDQIYGESPQIPPSTVGGKERQRGVPGIDTQPEGAPANPDEVAKRVPGLTTKTFPNGRKAYWGKDLKWHQILPVSPAEKSGSVR